MSKQEKLILRLTPIARLTMSLDQEMDLDKAGLFSEFRYGRYVEMYTIAERKRDGLMRSLLLLDALLALLLFGQSVNVPGIGLSIGEIPAIIEVITLFTTLTFFFNALAFLNVQAYGRIIDQFHIRKAGKGYIDPDFLSASDKYFEFVVKIYRKKFNICGIDLLIPGKNFRILSWIFGISVFVSLLVILVLHAFLIYKSIFDTITRDAFGLLVFSYSLCVVSLNFSAILMLLTMFVPFKFAIAEIEEETEAPASNQSR
jgi:hypothetical protein